MKSETSTCFQSPLPFFKSSPLFPRVSPWPCARLLGTGRTCSRQGDLSPFNTWVLTERLVPNKVDQFSWADSTKSPNFLNYTLSSIKIFLSINLQHLDTYLSINHMQVIPQQHVIYIIKHNGLEIFKRVSYCLATSSCRVRGYMDPTLETTGPELTTRVMNQFPIGHCPLELLFLVLQAPPKCVSLVTHWLGAQSKSMEGTGPSGWEPLAATDSRGRLMVGQLLSHTEPPLLRS